MDKHEFNIKVEQIKRLVNKGDYTAAMEIADDIDWRRVRNVSILSLVSTIYEKNENFKEAKDILLLAFERAPIGKRLLYKLAELAVKEGNIGEAEDYYREFSDLAPDDPRQYLLRYMILGAKGAPVQQLIHTLEQYCNNDLDEKWLYELATLYDKAGMVELCVMTCDKIMMMFGLGKFVDKARELKMQHAPLTKDQMDLEENRDRYEPYLRAAEQRYEGPMTDYDYDYEGTNTSGPVQVNRVPMPVDDETPVYGERQPYQELKRPVPVRKKQETQIPIQQYQDPVYEEQGEEFQQAVAIDPQYEEIPEDSVYLPDQETGAYQPMEEVAATYQPDISAASSASALSAAAKRAGQLTEEDLTARVHEAEAQANLARELSRLSGVAFSEESRQAKTRVLRDIRNLKSGEESEQQTSKQVPEPKASKISNHLMVEAEDAQEGLESALNLIKKIHRELGIKNQVAKTTGEKLNEKGVLTLSDKLVGKDLIVEYAGDMNDQALRELDQLMARDESGMNVVLIDNDEQLEAICEEYPGLARRFERVGEDQDIQQPVPVPKKSELSSREPYIQKRPVPVAPSSVPIKKKASSEQERTFSGRPSPVTPIRSAAPATADVAIVPKRTGSPIALQPKSSSKAVQPKAEPKKAVTPSTGQKSPDTEKEMDIDECAQYASQYASEIDCNISGKSMLALYERIEIMDEDGIPLTRENAENLIEEAADRAEHPPIGQRIKNLFTPKYDKDGLLILKEEHFI